MPRPAPRHANRLIGLLGLALLTVCGVRRPARFVVERDLDGYAYRRYQQVLDVEVPIEGNPAAAHTATYVRRPGDGGGDSTYPPDDRIAVAIAMVTRYARAEAVAAEVKEALDGLSSYEVRVVEREGAWMHALEGAGGDRWLLWVSGRHLVKLRAPDGAPRVPGALVSAYLQPYPSDLDRHGRARPDTASAGLSRRQRVDRESEEDLPARLREDGGSTTGADAPEDDDDG